ncbi:MAG: hypothetical protein RBR30_05345 [Tenuifilaceae bacterium]|nr:hypothetical protein [Tenuifilaceae bacterium]
MKKIGIVILGIGLLITIVTSVSFVTREKVVDVGDINISRNKNHSLAWSPIVGIVAMAVGGGLLLIGLIKK